MLQRLQPKPSQYPRLRLLSNICKIQLASSVFLTSTTDSLRLKSADEGMPVWSILPGYLAKTHYQAPKDPATAPFVENFGMQQWEYFRQNPEQGSNFNLCMEGRREGRGSWLDVYPVAERLQRGLKTDEDAVFFVDVAGGKGHDIRDVRDRLVAESGRLILEDLPEVIAEAHDLNGIEAMQYDFFSPQPVKGLLPHVYHPHDFAKPK